MTGPVQAVSSTPAAAVKLRQGTYIGSIAPASDGYPKAIEGFRGIPFAQSTADENRFRPPVLLEPSDQIFSATTLGQACPGSGAATHTAEAVVEGEDCLNLNLYRPHGAAGPGRRLPVVVYVHGGGFNSGSGTERDMASFVSWAREPIVGVSFNYRVGALGFLPSALTAREGLLNLGLRDQQMLFGWVRDNVAEFGGDPENVTLMGLSAGAHSIGHHLMYYAQSPDPPPFAKAILESGSTTARSVLYPAHPRHESQFREFLSAAGVSHLPKDGSLLRALRALPLRTLTAASAAVFSRHQASLCWPFQPTIDGDLIPDLPIRSWRRPRPRAPPPVLAGFCTDEGALFAPWGACRTPADFRALFRALLPALDPAALEAAYPEDAGATPPEGAGAQWARVAAAYGDHAYAAPVLHTAHFLGAAATPAAPAARVYRYAATGLWGRANHGDQGAVVAREEGALRGRPGLRRVAEAMHGAWVDFVVSREGRVGPVGDAGEWPVWETPVGGERPGEGAARIMVFGEGNDEAGGGGRQGTAATVGRVSAEEMERYRFWWERVELSEGDGRPPDGEAVECG